MTERIEAMLKQVKSSGPDMWDSDRVAEFVRSQSPELSPTERIEFVNNLAKRDIFLWLDFISKEILTLACTEPDYIDFLSFLIDKTRPDLASGQISQALTSVGEK